MTMEHLRYFLTATEYLNISKAANALFIHQSTLSRCIMNMEEEIGAPLFIRLKYSLQLTSAGMHLRDEALLLVEQYNQMMHRVSSIAQETWGQLTLLTPNTYFLTLSDAYGAFIHQHPKVDFSIEVCPYSKLDVISGSVLDGTIDMGITFSQNLPVDLSNLVIQKIYTEQLLLTVPRSHPLAAYRGSPIHLSQLHDCRILIADHMGKGFINSLYSTVNTKENDIIITHSASGETLLLQFISGMGLTFMPAVSGADKNSPFVGLEIADIPSRFDVFLVWRRDSTNPMLPLFLNFLKSHPPALHHVL